MLFGMLKGVSRVPLVAKIQGLINNLLNIISTKYFLNFILLIVEIYEIGSLKSGYIYIYIHTS